MGPIRILTLGTVALSIVNGPCLAELYRIQDVTIKRARPSTGRGGEQAESFSATDVVTHDPRAVLGKGFDVFTGEIVADAPCLEENGNDGGFGMLKVGRTHEYLSHNVVTSITSHQESSGRTVGFGATYKIITASANTGSSSENYFNASDSFARVYHSIVTKAQYRDGGKWSTNAANYLNEEKPTNFLKSCSTHYVAAIYSGHVIDETLRFTLRDDKRTAKDADSLTIGLKDILSFSTSSESSSTNVSTLATISDIKESYGVLAVQAPISKPDAGTTPAPGGQPGTGQAIGMNAITALLDYSKFEFPNKVAESKPDDAEVLYVDIRPYRERVLPHLDRIPEWPDEIFELMKGQAFLIEQLTTEISNLNYALGLDNPAAPGGPPTPTSPHPSTIYDQLYQTPRTEAEQKLSAATEVKGKFRDAIDACRKLMIGDTGTNAATACKASLAGAIDANKVRAAALVRKHG